MCVSYRTLIDGLCKDGNIEKEKEKLEEIFYKGFVPNVVTYVVIKIN